MHSPDRESQEQRPLLGGESGDSTYGTNSKNGAVLDSPELQTNDPESASGEPVKAEDKPDMKYILPALAVGIFLSAVDSSIINTNYGKIASDFERLELASWISTSFFLASSSAQPLYGKLSDVFGRKPCIIFCYGLFMLGCLLCGLARTMEQFITARIVQGSGAAGIGVLVTILISDLVPTRERGPWQGYLNLIVAAGLGLGGPIGGLMADSIGWRWSFYFQVPLMMLAIASVVFGLQVPKIDSSDWQNKLKRVDFIGALILVSTIVCFLLGLDRGSNVSWTAPVCFVPLALSPVLMVVYVIVEMSFAVEPLTPGHVIFNRTILSVYVCNFFLYGAWASLVFYVPLYYQASDGFSAAQSGILLLPATIMGVSGTLIGGYVIRRTGKYYWLMASSQGGATLAMILVVLGTVYVRFDILWISIGLAANCILFGNVVVGSLIALISNVGSEDQAVATACMFLFRSMGCAAGLSICGMALQQTLRTNLRIALEGRKDADEIVAGVRQSLDYIKTLAPDIQATVRVEYGVAARSAFILQGALFLAAFLAVVWVREKKLDR